MDDLPTSARDQTCAFCGGEPVAWVHPLDPDRVTFRVYGKGHTLPTFWTLCDRCEQLYQSGDVEATVELSKAAQSDSWASERDVDEIVRQPLAVFARADKGARRLSD